MLENVRNLDDGSFNVREIMNMFLDCVDASKSQTLIAFVQTRVDNEDSESEEENSRLLVSEDCQNAELEVVGPLENQHIWATIDEGCNSCCHG